MKHRPGEESHRQQEPAPARERQGRLTRRFQGGAGADSDSKAGICSNPDAYSKANPGTGIASYTNPPGDTEAEISAKAPCPNSLGAGYFRLAKLGQSARFDGITLVAA